MKKFVYTLIAAMVTVCAFAAAPNSSGTYYQYANGKKGSALKTAMCDIIYDRTEKSYDYLWTAFHTTDVRSDGKIWDMYSDNTNYVPGGSAQGANYSKEGDSYNREHSFPKSWFGGEVMPMYTDLHHMYPTDGYVNNKRGNYPFGETNGNTYKSHNSFSKLGTCTVSGYTGTVFEPADEYKGDFARTYFYMVTCYEQKLHDWYNGNADGVRATIDGSTYPGFQTWQLNMLLKWAKNDPVSQKEINRNTAVKNIQGNRNPFIDYPGLEQYIWGSMKDDTFSYDNYVQPTTWSTDYISSGSGSGGGGGTISGEADVINLALTGIESGSSAYANWSGKSGSTSSAVYAGNSAGGYNSIQLRSNNNNSGIVSTTSGGTVTKVSVTWNSNTASGRTMNVYGKNSAYSAVTDLYDSSTQGTLLGTIVYGTSTELTISDSYTYIGLRSASGAMYLEEIQITWDDGSSSVTLPDPTFNNLSDLSVNYGSTLTLTQGTTGTPNFVTDGTVTLESENTNVVTVDGLTITPVAVGTALITVNTSSTSAYNAGSIMFPITVNAPEGSTTAMPAESGLLFGETFGNNASSARTWTDSYSVKSGISDVYSGVSYTVTNAKQSKNTMGQTASALVSGSGTNGTFVVGPLNVANYSNLTASNYFGMSSSSWSSNSYMKLYYSTSTASNRAYTEVSRTDSNTPSGAVSSNSNLVQATYNLPQAAQSSTLYLKFEFYCYQINKNDLEIGQAYLDGVTITGEGTATIPVTLNGYGYATYCSEYPLDFSDYATADYSAWQITGISGSTITFSQITGSVKGGTGMLLWGTPNATVTLTSVGSSNTLDDNLLNGTLAPTYVAIGEAYGLSGNKFVMNNAAGTIPVGKAYLPASVVDVNEVKSFTFVFEDKETGINAARMNNEEMNNEQFIFNLAGQRLSKLQKGINIVNGKKVLVK